ncbi:MAG TPA: hypothetical protein VEX36_11465 [Thermoleophilaceae bacterium]|nr:hypothetical protein [Thermoleophilaceae bacterium]
MISVAPKPTLLVVLAIAATALAVPSALAQTEPELHNQTPRLIVQQEVHAGADVNCPLVTPTPPPAASPTVTAGGCRQHYWAPDLVWVGHLTAGGTEAVLLTCALEFDIRLDAAGEGWISHQEFTPQSGGGPCDILPCGSFDGEGRAWTTYMQESAVVGQEPSESMVILLCIAPVNNPSNSIHCEITVPMSQVATHRHRFGPTDVSGHGTMFPSCELTFTLDREQALGTTGEGQLEQNVEVRHT